MANTREVFGELRPYDPSKPKIAINLPTKEEIIAATLGLIPGYRALKNFHDNPEGPITETMDLAAEDLVPLYGSLIKPAFKGEDIDAEQALKEAAIFGIPMPYTKFPKGHHMAGETIPNNLKEGLGYGSWANTKSLWKNNKPTARKLYADPNDMQHRGSRDGGLSTRGRARRTYDEVAPVDVPAGPYQVTNNGSLVQNRGGTATRTNTIRTTGGHTPLKGSEAWQGDMYPPGRSLRKDDMYGPFQWEDKYSSKLNDVIDKNELKWEYLINQTRPITSGRFIGTELPKESAIETALKQGRPDIAERIVLDDKPRVPVNTGEFKSIGSQHRHSKLSNEEFKDIGNRQVEKELRETFATLPEDPDIRFRFADYYGVPDLYQSWMNDPLLWAKYKNDIQRLRYYREASNRSNDRRYGRNIER